MKPERWLLYLKRRTHAWYKSKHAFQAGQVEVNLTSGVMWRRPPKYVLYPRDSNSTILSREFTCASHVSSLVVNLRQLRADEASLLHWPLMPQNSPYKSHPSSQIMPPKEQTFDFETMAIVLYVMSQGGIKLGSAHYKMMSDATGNERGHDSFNHQFRAVKKRADEIASQVGVTPRKEGQKAAKVESDVKKRAKAIADRDGDDEAGEQTPRKKSNCKVKKENNSEEPESEEAAFEDEADGLFK
nr:hypothetical protein CFP56_10079 [Quercus suber]